MHFVGCVVKWLWTMHGTTKHKTVQLPSFPCHNFGPKYVELYMTVTSKAYVYIQKAVDPYLNCAAS